MNIAIFGLGLIGGSLGRATIAKTDNTVLGFDKDEQVMLKAELLGACSCRGNEQNVKDADLVIFALNPSIACEIMDGVCAKLKDGAVVIDTCGTKRKIVDEMERLHAKYPSLSFVGVHPMAGREYSGIEHATTGLFENAFIIMTPVHTDMRALSLVKNYFLSLGAEGIEVATSEKHDRIIAYTSQLAHVVSSSYVKNPLSKEYAGFSAGSFRDMTRVAKLNADMWTELFLENKDNLLAAIDDLQQKLGEYRDAIGASDENKLHKLLEDGTAAKAEADNLLKERRKND